MPDPIHVVSALCFLAAMWGFGFTAGKNYEKRQERERWRAWYRSMKGQR